MNIHRPHLADACTGWQGKDGVFTYRRHPLFPTEHGCADHGSPDEARVAAELRDVLTRLPTQRASENDELLPHRWCPV